MTDNQAGMPSALELLDRLLYGHNAASMGYEEQRALYEALRNAIQDLAPPTATLQQELRLEELTIEEAIFILTDKNQDIARQILELQRDVFPNGLKILPERVAAGKISNIEGREG